MFSANLRTSSSPSGRISQSGLRLDEALDVLAADQRQVVAELLAIEVVSAWCGGVTSSSAISSNTLAEAGKLLAQALGEAAINAAVLVLVGDGERQDFLLGQIGKSFHMPPLAELPGSDHIRIILNEESGLFDKACW